ncbi:MAG: VIT1/CCC1 transporter family protein [Nitrososphaera sp.]|jgi:VIT1/CCC1 family predicted Fe2+/Mn2+ transporter
MAKLRKPTKEPHSSHSILSDFILGSQDGLVNVLGILLGISAATSDVKILFVAAFAALGAESISMGAVAFTSTLVRRKQYLKEVERETKEMKEIPADELEEVRGILRNWGYQGESLETMANYIKANPKAMLEFMMSFELKLAPVAQSEAARSFVIVLSSTVFGSLIPLVPYFFVSSSTIWVGTIASVVLSGAVLFGIGAYEAKTTVGSVWKSGLQMTLIGLGAGLAGYMIGRLIGAAPSL